MFLLEFELTGSVEAASKQASCSASDLAYWRTADRAFSRDFALAALNHVKRLRSAVEAIAAGDGRGPSIEAEKLLASEHLYRSADSRLDLKRWRDELARFLSLHWPWALENLGGIAFASTPDGPIHDSKPVILNLS